MFNKNQMIWKILIICLVAMLFITPNFAWWNTSWGKCRSWEINETDGLNRINMVVNQNLTGLTITNATQIRIRNQTCTGSSGVEIPFSIIDTDSSTWVYASYYVNISASESISYSIFYNNSNAINPIPYDNTPVLVETDFPLGCQGNTTEPNIWVNESGTVLGGNYVTSSIGYGIGWDVKDNYLYFNNYTFSEAKAQFQHKHNSGIWQNYIKVGIGYELTLIRLITDSGYAFTNNPYQTDTFKIQEYPSATDLVVSNPSGTTDILHLNASWGSDNNMSLIGNKSGFKCYAIDGSPRPKYGNKIGVTLRDSNSFLYWLRFATGNLYGVGIGDKDLSIGELGSEEVPSGDTKPSITINDPQSINYYTTSIPVNITVSDDSPSWWCAIYENLNLLSNETSNTTYSTTLSKEGGSHNISVYCLDSANNTNSDSINYYVWMGLNISVYYDNGTEASNWNITITNTTQTNSTISNNTLNWEWNTIPYGNLNITVRDNNNNLYYHNYTNNSITNNDSTLTILNITLIEKSNNPLVLSSSLGWSILTGQITTINCLTTEGTPSVYKDYVSISIPFTASYPTNDYLFSCNVSETITYKPTTTTNTLIVSPLFGCISNTTFAYNKTITTTSNITTLNFTSLVDSNLVKPNLTDVYIYTNVSNIWKNGSYLIVNNTNLTSFVVKFTNYYNSIDYQDGAISGDVVNMDSYSQENIIYNIDLLSEFTGGSFFPPNATVTFNIYCDVGSTLVQLDNSTGTDYLFALSEQANWLRVKVKYTSQDFYSRIRYVEENQTNAYYPFYLIDAYNRALDKIDFYMDDPDLYESKLIIYKSQGSLEVIITEGYFDVAYLFSAYLGEDESYNLRTLLDGTLTELGFILVNEPAEKHLKTTTTFIPTVKIISDYITVESYFENESADITNIISTYEDTLSETINLTFTISYSLNDTVFYTNTYYNTSSMTLSIPNANTSYDYTIDYQIYHEELGNSPVPVHQLISTYSNRFNIFGNFTWMYPIMALLILIVTATTITPKSIVAGNIFLLTEITLFILIGWISINITTIVLFIFMLVLSSLVGYKNQQ